MSHGDVAGTGAMWSILIPCSWSTDITSQTFTSPMFIDALITSSHGNVALSWQTQITLVNGSIQFLITYNTHMNTYMEHNCTLNRLDGNRLTSASCVWYTYEVRS